MQQQSDLIEREEERWRGELESSDDPPSEDVSPSPNSPVVVSTITKNSKPSKKRGHPKKSDDTRDWEDDEIYSLIELWSQKEHLYNTKHKDYYNRDTRQNSLSLIQFMLAGRGIEATVKRILDKLNNLKNYYGGQKRLVENSKTSGARTDEIYESNWKFFQRLHFLSDAFTPRKAQSNLEWEYLTL